MRRRRVCIGLREYPGRRRDSSAGSLEIAMTSERGASRWTVAALLAVVIGVGVSVGVAQGWFDGGDGSPDPESEAAEGTSTSSSAVPTPTTTAVSTSTSIAPMEVGDHSLCALHEEMVLAVEGHLPVAGPDDLETFTMAQIEFHQGAVDVLGQPEGDGFAGMLVWYQALTAYYEPLEWNPSPGLEVLAENPPPQPSAEAVTAASRTLEELCGIVPGDDQPAP
jgi:hypothetical protein